MKILVGDIGGTHSRLAFIESSTGGREPQDSPKLHNIQQLVNANYSSPGDLIRDYLSATDTDPDSSCLAIAAPIPPAMLNNQNIAEQTVTLTNLPWTFSSEILKQEFNFTHAIFINDFAGLPYAINANSPWINSNDIQSFQSNDGENGQPINETNLYFGAGTGLGCVMSHQNSQGLTVLASEAGHGNISGATTECRSIARYIEKQGVPVSWESLLSGAGLERLYTFILQKEDTLPKEDMIKSAHDITAQAAQYPHSDEYQTIEFFSAMAGVFARNMAMNCLPNNIYLVGNIFRVIFDIISPKAFLRSFHNSTQHVELLKNINISLIQDTKIGLKGAAAYALKTF